MVNQNKIFSFKIKHQAKNVFPSDLERTVGRAMTYSIQSFRYAAFLEVFTQLKFLQKRFKLNLWRITQISVILGTA